MFFFQCQIECSCKENFATAYGFTHITSSPGVAQSNGEAKRHVETIKKSAQDRSMSRTIGLQSYITRKGSHSHAQLLICNRLCMPVHMHSTFISVLLDSITVTAEERGREKQQDSTTPIMLQISLSELVTCQPVLIANTQS